jgi:hypothetical protein
MRFIAFTAIGLAVLTGIAIAQEQPAPPPPPPGATFDAGPVDDAPPPHPGPGRHGDHGERGPMGGRDGERPPPPPSKAAHFRLEKGDLKLDVKCADDEPMKSCADIALQLLDKVAAKP